MSSLNVDMELEVEVNPGLPAELRTKATVANTEIATLTPLWIAHQNDHASRKSGRFWQGVKTERTASKHPQAGHEDEGWVDRSRADILPTTEGVSLAVDVYEGPEGNGCVFRFTIEHDGTLYHREVNQGPESHRTRNWYAET